MAGEPKTGGPVQTYAGGDSPPLKRDLLRLSLYVPGGTRDAAFYHFRINPENLSRDIPARATVVQTADGPYVDHFGEAVGQITFSGTTGTGYLVELKKLKALVDSYNARMRRGETLAPAELHNWTDAEHVKVIVQNLRIYRNIQRPTLYQYEFRLDVLSPDVEKRGGTTVFPVLPSDLSSFEGSLIQVGGIS